MRLYLDQMLRAHLAPLLQAQGHDVLRATETGQSRADDSDILERATRDRRILVTLDGHFGDWVVLPLFEHFGVIRVKAHPATTQNIAQVLGPLLARHTEAEFRNHLVIASPRRTRWVRTFGD